MSMVYGLLFSCYVSYSRAVGGLYVNIEQCVDDGYYVVVDSPAVFRDVVRFMDKRYIGVASLVLVMRRDIETMLRGTHGYMDRCIARLEKLRRVLTGTYVGIREPSIYGGITLGHLLEVPMNSLGAAVNAMRLYRGYTRRIRIRVHELLYPVLRDVVDQMLYIRLVFRPRRWYPKSVEIECRFDYGNAWLGKVGKTCWIHRYDPERNWELVYTRKITVDEAIRIADKVYERRKREIDGINTNYEQIKYLYGRTDKNPYAYLEKTIGAFFSSIIQPRGDLDGLPIT